MNGNNNNEELNKTSIKKKRGRPKKKVQSSEPTSIEFTETIDDIMKKFLKENNTVKTNIDNTVINTKEIQEVQKVQEEIGESNASKNTQEISKPKVIDPFRILEEEDKEKTEEKFNSFIIKVKELAAEYEIDIYTLSFMVKVGPIAMGMTSAAQGEKSQILELLKYTIEQHLNVTPKNIAQPTVVKRR